MRTKRCKMFNYITFLMFIKQKKLQFSPFPVEFSILVKFKIAAKMADTFDDITGSPQRRTP